MNQTKLINAIYINLLPQKVKKKDIHKVVKSLFNILKNILIKGEKVRIKNFGIFFSKHRKVKDKVKDSKEWIDKAIIKIKLSKANKIK
ncbi:MAG: HU family DNA-binding protein [bacterium]